MITTTERVGTQQRIRVLIVDDQPLVRRGLALMLSLESDMEVLGEAGDGAEAVEMARRLRSDVVLMDLHMPRKGGVAATREITAVLPQYSTAWPAAPPMPMRAMMASTTSLAPTQGGRTPSTVMRICRGLRCHSVCVASTCRN